MLPDDFVERYINKGKKSKLFGVDIEELNRDELLAAIGFAGEEINRLRKETSESLSFLSGMIGIRHGRSRS